MRTPLLFLAAASVAACDWREFDTLADSTWVRSSDDPNIGSRNYGLAILGVTTGTSGGQLGVISDDTPDYSTIDYAADGTDTVGAIDVKLNQHRIAALTDPPLFATDGMGNIAIAERSTTGGNVAVVYGSATSPSGLELAAPGSPDAVTFAGSNIVVAAGNTLFTLQDATQIPCASNDSAFAVAALASDGTDLWVWAKSGAFFSIPLADLDPCAGGTLPEPATSFATPLAPAPGARVHLVGDYAILTGHAQSSRMGQVFVVELATLSEADTMTIEGLRSSTIATFGTSTYLAVGVPDRAVGNVIAGQVDLYAFDPTTGMLTKSPALQLADAQPESGQLFGRSVTTMNFNGQPILVVAANSEVFAYYKTALYDALP